VHGDEVWNHVEDTCGGSPDPSSAPVPGPSSGEGKGGGGEGGVSGVCGDGDGELGMHSACPPPLYVQVPDWPVQPPPCAVQITVSPAAGSDVGVPPLGSVLSARKVHPPPPLQQVEPTDEKMTHSTCVSSVWPVTTKSKLPGAYPSGRVVECQ
jgi:hypothetical protein